MGFKPGRRPCKACGKPLVFAVNPKSGAVIPLDLNSMSHTYELAGTPEGDEVAIPAGSSDGDEGREFMVSHFLTCTAPRQFSKKGKANAGT